MIPFDDQTNIAFLSQPEPAITKYTTSVYREADAFLFVYDVTNKNSFDSLHDWVNQIEAFDRIIVQPKPRYLVATKCDLESVVPVDLVQTFVRDNNATLFEVSGIDFQNLDKLLTSIHSQLFKTEKKPEEVVDDRNPGSHCFFCCCL